jgi:hypothetical protein
MVRAVNQHAGDTGRSHLADRYFLRALHRGSPLDGQPGARATWTARAGPAEQIMGGETVRLGTTIQLMVSALDRNRVTAPPSICFELSLVPLQLALPPVRVFTRRLEHPLDMTVQRFHDADASEHRRPVKFGDEQ